MNIETIPEEAKKKIKLYRDGLQIYLKMRRDVLSSEQSIFTTQDISNIQLLLSSIYDNLFKEYGLSLLSIIGITPGSEMNGTQSYTHLYID